MKRFWSALLILLLGTVMSAQTTSGTSKPAKNKHAAAASKPTTADELRE